MSEPKVPSWMLWNETLTIGGLSRKQWCGYGCVYYTDSAPVALIDGRILLYPQQLRELADLIDSCQENMP